MANMINYKELNEKIAMLEAAVRKQLNAPVALVPNATPEQMEEHVVETVEFLYEHEFPCTDNGMQVVLGVKAFDDAVAKACAEYVLMSTNVMIGVCLDTNNKLNDLYPFRDEYSCNIVADILLKHGVLDDIKKSYLQSFGFGKNDCHECFDASFEPEEYPDVEPVCDEEGSDVAPAFDEEYVLTYLSDELYDFVLDVLAGRFDIGISFPKEKIIDLYRVYCYAKGEGSFDGSFSQYVYALHRQSFLESFKLALAKGECTVDDGI